MTPLKLQTPYQLKEILAVAYTFNDQQMACFDDVWLFSANAESSDDLTAETIIYFDKPVAIDCEQQQIEHKDFFSEFVKEHDLWNCYYGEQFVDVLSHYKDNSSQLDIDLLITGLNYYADRDDFYDY